MIGNQSQQPSRCSEEVHSTAKNAEHSAAEAEVQLDESTSQLQFINEPSVEPLQPFEASLSDIHHEDTLHLADFNEPDPEASPRQPAPEHEEKWSTNDSLPVLKRRRPKQPPRGREPDQSYDHYSSRSRGFRSNSRGRWQREDRYQRSYYNEQYERESHPQNHHREYEHQGNRRDQAAYYDDYNYRAAPVYPPQQQLPPEQAYLQSLPVQSALANFLALKEYVRCVEMYYAQGYQSMLNPLLYANCQALPYHYTQHAMQTQPTEYTPTPAKQEELPKKETVKVIPESFGKICLPKFEINVNGCSIAVTCCKMDRLHADILLIPYATANFGLFPGFKPEEYFSTKQRGDAEVKQAMRNQTNGRLSLVRTDRSSFKTVAFLKVCNPSEEIFGTLFNRGLSNLLGEPSEGTGTAVVPYSNEFGSSQEKAKRLVDLMSIEGCGWSQIVVNCEDMTSFKRMVEGFSRICCQLDERGSLSY